MFQRCLWRIGCTAIFLSLTSISRSEEPALVSLEKIWDQGPHNAFTDLVHWRDHWYCTFREADDHVGGDGKLRVLVSADGDDWESAALITEDGIDLRDPKFSITPDDRLMIVAGGSLYEGRTLLGRQPRVTFSEDGRNWTAPKRVLSEGEWLWRVTWHDGKAYGISYNASTRTSPEAKKAAETGQVEPGPADWKLKLFESEDGETYNLVTQLDVPGHPNESTIRFLPDGEMIALVRREGGSTFAWIGSSQAPYKDWKWTETGHRVGGPNFLRLPDGSIWAGGRSYPGGAKTVLARMAPDHYEPALTLPSGGDNSYPGLVWHDGLLWFSYYSSHEGKSAIYLARIKLPIEAKAADNKNVHGNDNDQAEEIGSRVELFVDEHLLDRLEGSARLEVQRPEPQEIVLKADLPWEGNTSAYFTIFQDGDNYRMYYRGSHFDEEQQKGTHRELTCYAESKDGIQWTKPNLGLFEFEGSTQNNIVWDGPGTHNFTPFLDQNPQCPPESKYKALARAPGGLLAFQSADGIHWELMQAEPVITQGAFDSQNLAFFDKQVGKYREYHRAFRGVRDIMTGTSDDFLQWTGPEFLEYQQGTPAEHLYTNAILPYPRAPHILIGFPTRFLPDTQQTEPIFMSSRDGQSFRRFSEPVIPPTATADRDGNRSNYMAWGLVSLPEQDRALSVYAKEAYYTGPGSRVRRFSYRLDGFVALHADSQGGEALTKPIRFQGDSLVLNARIPEEGSIRVELQDLDGTPLPGFRAEDCQELTGDHLEQNVSWAGNGKLADVSGRPVRLRFVIKDADVFSYQFR